MSYVLINSLLHIYALCYYCVYVHCHVAVAEVISKKQTADGKWEFYVHYINCKMINFDELR